MKKFLSVFSFFSVVALTLFVGALAYAQAAFPGAPVLDTPPSSAEISAFLASLQGLAGPLAIALAASQGLLLVARWFGLYAKIPQKWALVFSSGVHVLVGSLTMLAAGATFGEIVANAAALAAFGNLLFSIVKAFFTPAGDK